jgi:hypothetical protein
LWTGEWDDRLEGSEETNILSFTQLWNQSKTHQEGKNQKLNPFKGSHRHSLNLNTSPTSQLLANSGISVKFSQGTTGSFISWRRNKGKDRLKDMLDAQTQTEVQIKR